ncbi:holin-like protein [Gibbsiella quercinecans]|uniref:UPF0299 membrane protein AWC35_04375 n=2 Tax=Gibbsiella TaxID=929812 RepID=A0A250AY69_9GAMM|nr:CidA/LrgA family protein [Gibbsiella quercinecans]ATA18642.1 hypothetical protein AWC35_04375 [Gibbsiella quercinecans]RLM02758.1 hypothetical protein BIY31_23055 [Gibbsiella quercinecans]RLM03107.1 hypothetical protein BIY27_24125 [Gibbsiella quercinecans]RLM14890.1 hypothetical protein BIY30_00135 [Gibbsiella quercinecans]TCT91841.1 holin-like protein [Gibbsiella quercinecans]
MGNMYTQGWRYLRSFGLIYLCLFAGNAISALLPIVIPGSIIGMLILFALLASQIVRSSLAKPGCHFFIRYMVLLFVPIGVGVMKYYDQLIAHLGPLVVSCLVSTLVVLLVVGYSSHYLHSRHPLANKKVESAREQK